MQISAHHPPPPPGSTRSGPTRAGVLKMLPIALAYIPFAVTVGSAVAADRTPVAAWAGTWTIFGGSAHLAVLQNLRHGSVLLAVVTGLVINARMLVYSSSLSADWRCQPRWFRLIAAAVLIDPTWAAGRDGIDRFPDPGEQRRHYLGSAVTLGGCWGVAITVGALVGTRLGHTIDLSISGPLCLVALVGPRLARRQNRPAVVAAALAASVFAWAPDGAPVAAAVVVACIVADRTREIES